MEKIKTLVIASGYFNPLHVGHVEYLQKSKDLGDYLVVIINNDLQRELKGSKEFQNQDERKFIVENLKSVDSAMISLDKNRFVDKSIEFIVKWRGASFDKILFTNGGDQTEPTKEELEMCEKLGIEMVFGLGEKIQSSSWLLKK